MVSLGINLWNFENELNDRCLGLPTFIKEIGYTAIEIPMTTTILNEKLIKEIKNSGLKVSLCASLGGGKDMSSFDDNVRKISLNYLKECIDVGEKLNAELICGPLYAGSGKRHILDEHNKQKEWNYAVEGIRELGEYARGKGIKIAIEPINKYRTKCL